MHGLEEANVKASKPEAIFETILRKLENNVSASGQIATRSRVLVEKIIGGEPQPDSPEVMTEPNSLTDKLARLAEELRVNLNETAEWITKLEGTLN